MSAAVVSAPAPSPANPARHCRVLAALFPGLPVQGAQLHYHSAAVLDPRALLTREEWDGIRHCAPKRIHDFTAGRMCARRALQGLGVRDFSLRVGPDRCPLWPRGVIGSITHTQGYSAAVVARADAVAALGIDTEVISAVHARLWPSICTCAELERLRQLDPESRIRAAALTFAAKEAYFKCQYPLTHELLGFEAVQLDDIEVHGARFRVLPRQGRLLAGPSGTVAAAPLEGRYRLHGAFITAALALPL